MRDSILLSVVMPVYNAAPYLPACLDSLAVQTLVPDEIIAIDDGSTDDSPAILASYAQRLPGLRVIRQENGGAARARNAGIEAARGRYLAFIDADDFVEPDMYRTLIDMAQQDGLDMALVDAWFHHEGRKPDHRLFGQVPDEGTLPGRDWFCRRLREGVFLHMTWFHLYRRGFIEEQGLRFVPGITYEDVIWSTQAFLAAQRVRFAPVPLYRYRLAVRCPKRTALIRSLQRIIDSSIYNARALAAIAAQEPDAEAAHMVRWQLVDGAMSVFHKIKQLPDPALRADRRRQLRREGFYRFLWQHAVDYRQRRRILGNYVRNL